MKKKLPDFKDEQEEREFWLTFNQACFKRFQSALFVTGAGFCSRESNRA